MNPKDDGSIKKMIIQFIIIMVLIITVMILVTPMIENLDAQLQLTRQPDMSGEWRGGP